MPENMTRVDAEARAAVVSKPSTKLVLTVSDDPSAATFRAETTLSFDAASAGASTYVDLTAANVHSLELNGVALPASAYDAATNRVRLSGLVAGRNELRVVADVAYGNSGVGLHRTIDPEDDEVYLYSHCEPFDAHKFVACFDQPDLKGPLDLTITGPARWTYVANEDAAKNVDNGDGTRTVTFAPTPSISSYLYAVAAGPYVELHENHNGLDLVLYARQALAAELRAQAPEMFDVTKRGIDYYESRFKQKYPFNKYAQLMVPDFNEGAMENPGCITVNDALCIFRGPVSASLKAYRNDIILHEMAHMWFGDLVTMRWWNDLWLNESFATVMALLAERDAFQSRRPLVDFANQAKTFALRDDQMPSTHPISANVPDIETVRLNFDGISYDKGASVLYQLIAWVGEDAFFEGTRQYFAAHSWSNASLDDLLGALESASGRNLRQWAHEWLETTGPSALSADFAVANDTYSNFSITQDSAVIRSHRIRIGLYDQDSSGRLTRREQVEIDVAGPTTAVPQLVGKRAAALVVVNDDDLTYAKMRLDARSLDTIVAGLATIDDPLTRALCWASTWDMTRDAEMPASSLVALIASQGVAETEATVVDRLTQRASSAITFYADPAHQKPLRAVMFDAARRQVATAAPGSDLQLSWLGALVGNAERPSDYAFLEKVLAGTAGVDAPGLQLSPDMRWDILTVLVAAGRADRPEINAELAKDPSVTGRYAALEARAAMPTAAAKIWAWQQMQRADLPLKELKAIIAGFQQEGQNALTAQYTAQLPGLLATWWSTRDDNSAEVLTSGVFPRFTIDDATVALADTALATAGLTTSARRILAEQRDAVQRSQRARSRDRSTPEASPPSGHGVA